ncbi:MAG: glycoside hydrolase family 3 C-terminal domain-containing protein [Oscillospiraceae bacterium]
MMKQDRISVLISQMTLEEKAALCSGKNWWNTQDIKRLGIRSVMVSDATHGLRKQDEGMDTEHIGQSVQAICFPASCALAASFDRSLLQSLGETIGDECQAENIGVILGPAVNIKRSPLCGRNFEYLSEDPYAAGELAAAYIRGVQSRGVGTSVKHFYANNQENRRHSSSSEVDERTLREIYLPAFDRAVQEQPWTVMASYNRINGVHGAQNKWGITQVLRGQWGFDGTVISDWGAVTDRAADLAAGLDLEMPGNNGANDARIIHAVKTGQLQMRELDAAVRHVLELVERVQAGRRPDTVWDQEQDHEKARKLAASCMVLLKNEGAVLPLHRNEHIAFIGEYARTPRYQGGGSSHVNPYRVSNARESARKLADITYAAGYCDAFGREDDVLEAEAVAAAKRADKAVIFAGLPESYESEGYDRTHMRMPAYQNRLIEEIAAVQPNTIVVLHNGAPVEMPWAEQVKGILESYLGGEAVGEAQTDILFGAVSPSGKLSESFPEKLEDNPSYLFYGDGTDKAEYREGIFVGYRYYDKKMMNVRFPFGHGLSYASFAYSGLKLDRTKLRGKQTLQVCAQIKNTGAIPAAEVVQLYIRPHDTRAIRPLRELKGFEKVMLEPGEEKTVRFTLNSRAFACWHTELHDFHVPEGKYEIELGSSSRDIRLSETVFAAPEGQLPRHYTVDTTIGDLREDAAACKLLANADGANWLPPALRSLAENLYARMQDREMDDWPLRVAVNFGDGALHMEQVEALCAILQAARTAGEENV